MIETYRKLFVIMSGMIFLKYWIHLWIDWSLQPKNKRKSFMFFKKIKYILLPITEETTNVRIKLWKRLGNTFFVIGIIGLLGTLVINLATN